MGYYENPCQLCAVVMNISRLRTKYESNDAAWGYSGRESRYYLADSSDSTCMRFQSESGCEHIELEADERPDTLHIAGSGCTFIGGYSGYRIGVEEMKDIYLSRYIVPKPDGAKPEDDEEDYERDSDYFISSLTVSTSVEFDIAPLKHVRYGVESFLPQNYDVMGDDTEFGIPVHDSCWKIFERVSRLRLGKVDLQGLMALWWYLVANPHDIPGFILAIQDAYIEYPSGNGAIHFNFSKAPDNKYSNPTDPFTKVPAELKNMILSHLPAKSIANVRLVSRAFRQLPKQLFRRLILEEMPWFWEIDQIEEKQTKSWSEEYKKYGEDLVDLPESFTRAAKESMQDMIDSKKRDINWKNVYEKLKLLEKSIKGVRNRARVWGVVTEVVERIERLRKRFPHDLPLRPTQEELDSGHACSRCSSQWATIERTE